MRIVGWSWGLLALFMALVQPIGLGAEQDEPGSDIDLLRTAAGEETLGDLAGAEVETDLWTTCFTPRELRLLCDRAGLDVTDIYSVRPGDYAHRPPDLEHPEFLVLGRRRT